MTKIIARIVLVELVISMFFGTLVNVLTGAGFGMLKVLAVGFGISMIVDVVLLAYIKIMNYIKEESLKDIFGLN